MVGRTERTIRGMRDKFSSNEILLTFSALAIDNVDKFNEILAPTLPLSRKIFEAPTQYYKAGVVFLAWLNGHQNHFIMPAGMQAERGIIHYSQVFRLADQANVLDKPELAVARMKTLLAMHGIAG